jgi:N-acetylglucosamine kinase-like BadF-type ATPase
MEYLIGFDCGATKTECAIADIKGTILNSITGEAANLLVSGSEKVLEIIFSIIDELKSELKFNYSDICSIVVGAAGAGRESDAKMLKDILIEKFNKQEIVLKSLQVVNDAHIALEGAFPKKAGCILIAGTGSIIYGKDEKRNFYRVGGFGRVIGDEGSGYSIGKKALQHFSKYLDGRTGKTKLAQIIQDNYNINAPDELIKKIYIENFDIAPIAEIAIKAADSGDQIAKDILDKESDEMLLLIKSMANKISIKNLTVAFGGSLLTNLNYYSKVIKEKISLSFPSVQIVNPQHTPVEGAILLAKEMLND